MRIAKRRHTAPAVLIAVVLAVAALAAAYILYANPNLLKPHAASQTRLPAKLAHIFVIVEENKPYSSVIGNAQAPYINQLATRSALATNYHGVAHPSLPNYIALTSGSTQGITSDCTPPANCQVDATNLADELERAGVSWKEYAEDMPSPCADQDAGRYATKHVPFLYYSDILNNAARCHSHVVPASQLSADLSSAATTPGFALISPNLCDDAHDCPLSTADAWLSHAVPEILTSKSFTAQPSLLVITWDEADASSNLIPTILAGNAAKPGYRSAAYADHYSLLKTIEQNWQLPALAQQDASASALAGFLN